MRGDITLSDIALVFMPWASVSMPSIALGLLKNVLEENEISADVHYLNVKLAKLMDKVLYEEISGSTTYASEWLFSQSLYHEDKIKDGNVNFNQIIGETIEYDHYLYMYLKRRKDVLQPVLQKIIPKFIEECLDSINWGAYKAIGFSCMIGYQMSALLFSKKLKERFPDIKIIFGGPNVREKTGEEILKNFDYVDYIIDGEGELALPELVNNIKAEKFYEKIPGVLFKRNGIVERVDELQEAVELDKLPIPDYSDYFNEINGSGIENEVSIMTSFESSRGCWWGQKCQCTFCGLSNGYLKYRSKSAKKVLEELIEQSEKYNIKSFFATDLILCSDFYKDLIPELIERNLNLDIFYEIKPNIKSEQIKMLRKAGIKTVQAGIESLNTKLLKLLRKGVTAIQNIHFMKTCEENDILVKWNLLYRIPGEQKESYEEMIHIIPSLVHLRPPAGGTLIQIALDRFSPYYNDKQKYGLKDIKPKGFYYLSYPNKEIDLNNIAYTFEFSYDNADRTVLSYIENLALHVSTWQKNYDEKNFYFTYINNDGTIQIEDNRPVSFQQLTTKVNYYTLEGIESYIFLLCNDVCSFEQIFISVCKDYQDDMDREQLKMIMNKLVGSRLLFEESGMYVNLALDNSVSLQISENNKIYL